MNPLQLADTAGRAAAVYVMILVLVRLMGKRTVGNFSPFDLLVAIMLGEAADKLIYGDVGLLQGAVALASIAAMHELNAWTCYLSPRAAAFLEGTPTVLVREGQLQRKGMRSERMSEDEVRSLLRVEGVEDLEEVQLAQLENDGELSVQLYEWARPARQRDLG